MDKSQNLEVEELKAKLSTGSWRELDLLLQKWLVKNLRTRLKTINLLLPTLEKKILESTVKSIRRLLQKHQSQTNLPLFISTTKNVLPHTELNQPLPSLFSENSMTAHLFSMDNGKLIKLLTGSLPPQYLLLLNSLRTILNQSLDKRNQQSFYSETRKIVNTITLRLSLRLLSTLREKFFS